MSIINGKWYISKHILLTCVKSFSILSRIWARYELYFRVIPNYKVSLSGVVPSSKACALPKLNNNRSRYYKNMHNSLQKLCAEKNPNTVMLPELFLFLRNWRTNVECWNLFMLLKLTYGHFGFFHAFICMFLV